MIPQNHIMSASYQSLRPQTSQPIALNQHTMNIIANSSMKPGFNRPMGNNTLVNAYALPVAPLHPTGVTVTPTSMAITNPATLKMMNVPSSNLTTAQNTVKPAACPTQASTRGIMTNNANSTSLLAANPRQPLKLYSTMGAVSPGDSPNSTQSHPGTSLHNNVSPNVSTTGLPGPAQPPQSTGLYQHQLQAGWKPPAPPLHTVVPQTAPNPAAFQVAANYQAISALAAQGAGAPFGSMHRVGTRTQQTHPLNTQHQPPQQPIQLQQPQQVYNPMALPTRTTPPHPTIPIPSQHLPTLSYPQPAVLSTLQHNTLPRFLDPENHTPASVASSNSSALNARAGSPLINPTFYVNNLHAMAPNIAQSSSAPEHLSDPLPSDSMMNASKSKAKPVKKAKKPVAKKQKLKKPAAAPVHPKPLAKSADLCADEYVTLFKYVIAEDLDHTSPFKARRMEIAQEFSDAINARNGVSSDSPEAVMVPETKIKRWLLHLNSKVNHYMDTGKLPYSTASSRPSNFNNGGVVWCAEVTTLDGSVHNLNDYVRQIAEKRLRDPSVSQWTAFHIFDDVGTSEDGTPQTRLRAAKARLH